MDYEKKYNEALERAKQLISKWTSKNKDFYVEDYSYIFPELAESEDEKIRKALISYHRYYGRDVHALDEISPKQIVTYLENQKERKPVEWSEEEAINEIMPILNDVANQGTFGNPTKERMIEFAKRILKTLSPQPKQEWSEEDEAMRDRIIDILNRTFSVYSALGTSSTRPACPTFKEEIAWLKSLLPSWKPSKEQMEKEFPKWRKIKAGERLPCPAYVWTIVYDNYPDCFEGRLIPNIQGVKVGEDTWYLPVDVIHNLPKEDEK